MARVAIFTDSASDLDPAEAAASGIHVVPLIVNFGTESFRAGVDLSGPSLLGPDDRARCARSRRPRPRRRATSRMPTRRPSPTGAEAIVVGPRGRDAVGHDQERPDRARHAARPRDPRRRLAQRVDGRSGILAPDGHRARRGRRARPRRSPPTLEERAQDLRIYFALETLEYLKKGGRISGTQAAIGTLLSVKPVIMLKHGEVTTVDRVRTRSKARDRLIELDHREAGRAAVDPAFRRPPTSRRSGPSAGAPPGPRSRRRVGRARRRLGRAARRARAASAPRSSIEPGERSPGAVRRICDGVAGCGSVATTLPTGTIGQASATPPRLYSGVAHESRVADPADRSDVRSMRPVGSSGRRPRPTRRPRRGRPTRRFLLR